MCLPVTSGDNPKRRFRQCAALARERGDVVVWRWTGTATVAGYTEVRLVLENTPLPISSGSTMHRAERGSTRRSAGCACASGLEQEPSAPLGLVDPVLQQACGGDVAVPIA
jgi:hypothetical protein